MNVNITMREKKMEPQQTNPKIEVCHKNKYVIDKEVSLTSDHEL